MKKLAITISLLLCTVLTSCGLGDAKLVGIKFERGHGSAWGNQFYIDVCAEQIVTLQTVSPDTAQLETQQNIPIHPEQWQELVDAVKNMELKEARNNWIQKLFGSSKQDGGAFRRLTLVWQAENTTVEKTYQWPQTTQADNLEKLLEQLA